MKQGEPTETSPQHFQAPTGRQGLRATAGSTRTEMTLPRPKSKLPGLLPSMAYRPLRGCTFGESVSVGLLRSSRAARDYMRSRLRRLETLQ